MLWSLYNINKYGLPAPPSYSTSRTTAERIVDNDAEPTRVMQFRPWMTTPLHATPTHSRQPGTPQTPPTRVPHTQKNVDGGF